MVRNVGTVLSITRGVFAIDEAVNMGRGAMSLDNGLVSAEDVAEGRITDVSEFRM